MSLLDSFNDESEIFEPEVESSPGPDDLKKKFKLYRSNTELITTKYKEAKTVIERLKEEVNVSRETEKFCRIRISSLQSRLSVLEENRTKLNELLEKQRNDSEKIRKTETSITNISKVVEELKQKIQTLISSIIQDMEVIKENKDLQYLLKSKEAELQMLKTRMQSSMSEREELIKRYEAENEELRKKIEISKSVADDRKEHYDKIINKYKQQTMDYERIIEDLEKERKSLLGDYDIGNAPQYESKSATKGNHHNDKTFTCPDSTVTCFTVERENGTQQLMDVDLTTRKMIDDQSHCNTAGCSESKLFCCNSLKANNGNKAYSQPSKLGFKHKPKLDFLDTISEPLSVHSYPQPKKRLYSQNSNHYIN